LPTYTYRCKKCQMEFDQFQSIVDPPLKVCPSCKGELQRVITGGSGLIFKGSGFYITDYVKKSSKINDKDNGKSEKQKSQPKPSTEKSASTKE
jgi:putative FmdB family regulatory protein